MCQISLRLAVVDGVDFLGECGVMSVRVDNDEALVELVHVTVPLSGDEPNSVDVNQTKFDSH